MLSQVLQLDLPRVDTGSPYLKRSHVDNKYAGWVLYVAKGTSNAHGLPPNVTLAYQKYNAVRQVSRNDVPTRPYILLGIRL